MVKDFGGGFANCDWKTSTKVVRLHCIKALRVYIDNSIMISQKHHGGLPLCKA